jgi:predicted RNA methylase
MSSMTLSAARERFREIATVIDAAPGAGAIAAGFAALTSHETASELIACARSDLIVTRGGVSTTDNRPSAT